MATTNTIPLKRLFDLFGESVNNAELPPPVRQLAARQMTLTSHVMRIEAAAAKRLQAADAQIAELAGMVQSLLEQRGVAPAEVAPTAAPAAAATPPAEIAEEKQEEDEDEAFAKKILAETDAEVAAINANVPDVTPLPVKKVAK